MSVLAAATAPVADVAAGAGWAMALAIVTCTLAIVAVAAAGCSGRRRTSLNRAALPLTLAALAIVGLRLADLAGA